MNQISRHTMPHVKTQKLDRSRWCDGKLPGKLWVLTATECEF